MGTIVSIVGATDVVLMANITRKESTTSPPPAPIEANAEREARDVATARLIAPATAIAVGRVTRREATGRVIGGGRGAETTAKKTYPSKRSE